jgi:hypothetical protein
MRAALPAVLSLIATAAFATPPPYELAVDVPSVLGGWHVGPQQVERHAGAGYAAIATFPNQVAIGALHRRADGAILFAPEHAVVLDGVTYEPRDVVAYTGGAYASVFDGSSSGVPVNARIDALYLDSDGSPVMSFDVPVRLDGVWRGRSNLMRYAGGAWTLVWDAAAAGVPASVNVVGADRLPSGEMVVSFDIPVRIGGALYRPGQLVGWNGASFEDVATDPAWPPSAQLRDFSFLPAAGAVAETLLIGKAADADLALTWGPSCAGTDIDFEVYEGALAAGFTSHAPVLCSTGGATSVTLLPGDGDRYFLIVPRNAVTEGSYCAPGDGVERPPASAACLPRSVVDCSGH